MRRFDPGEERIVRSDGKPDIRVSFAERGGTLEFSPPIKIYEWLAADGFEKESPSFTFSSFNGALRYENLQEYERQGGEVILLTYGASIEVFKRGPKVEGGDS